MSAAAEIRPVRAGPDLDAELLRFTASVETGRGFRISLDRSPSFFSALEVEGDDPAVCAFVTPGGDDQAARVVGTGTMTQRAVFLNRSRVAEPVGQLGSGRIDPRFRGGTMVARCFRFLHEWHLERQPRVFLTTILEDNVTARAIFESGRAGLPRYRDWGRLVTLNCPVGRTQPVGLDRSVEFRVSEGSPGDEPLLVEFWNAHGPRRQFFPAYQQGHLRQDGGLLRGLRVQDLLLCRARTGGEILGTLGVWNQSDFRRWVVNRLPGTLRLSAPLLDLHARLTGGLRLPRPGESLDQRFVACCCAMDDDPGVFGVMLEAARDRLARQGGAWLTLGLHESDPLLATARRMKHRELYSRLYLVHWHEGREAAEAIEPDRCPYVEIGGL
jgi:hypothetical protein